jgi:hypothetical protein
MHFKFAAQIELELDLGPGVAVTDELATDVSAAVADVLTSSSTRERLDDVLRGRLGTLGLFEMEVTPHHP